MAMARGAFVCAHVLAVATSATAGGWFEVRRRGRDHA
jgi:hypothetical protein